MQNINWAEDELGSIYIRDGRIVDRLIKTCELLAERPNCSIPEACGTWKDTKAAYRLLDNNKVSYEAIIKSHRQQTIDRIHGKDIVLAVQDTTTLDYSSLRSAEGLGYTSIEITKGILVHTTLAVEPTGNPLGILDQYIWTRDAENKKAKDSRYKLAIKEKESNKWLDALENSIEGVPQNTNIITVCDREADIYDFFNKAAQENKDFLIRATQNRLISEEHKTLKNEIEHAQIAGNVTIAIPRDTRNSRKPREAELSIKFCTVTVKPPFKRSSDKSLKPIKLSCILAEEINGPVGVTPISWLLLTSIPVITFEDAIEKIKWYTQRWKVERYHYTLKSGCRIEELQLEDTKRIKNAIAIYSIVAWRILFLTYQSREKPDTSCEEILSKHEWQSLCCMVNKIPTPPETPPTLNEAVLMIAKLGGFLGRKHDGNPGVKVIWRGLQRLHDIAELWKITNCQDSSISVGNA